ncbi:MAG: hypothetical protein ACK5PG_07885 [Lysobacterales bacterium]|jgi:hypothetical protein
MRLRSTLALLALLPFTASHAATTYTVTSTADSGAGSLRAAIQSLNANTAENNHTIAFAVGSGQTIQVLSNLPAIGRSGAFVSIDGSGSPGLQIDGMGTSRLLFSFENALFSVRDLTLTRGFAGGGGCLRSGVDASASSPMVVARVLFSGCLADIQGGGAIYAGAQLTVTDSVFLDNQVTLIPGVASGGGAIIKTGAGNLIVERSTFVDNRVQSNGSGDATPLGGALYMGGSSLNHTVRDSGFSGNRVGNPGGTAGGFGGAIHLESGGLSVERSFLRGNVADREGGAISVAAFVNASAARSLSVRNSSFVANSAGWGGAIHFANYGGTGGVLDIRNSLFERNGASSGSGQSLRMADNVGSFNLSHTAFGAAGLDGSATGSHCSGTANTHSANATLQGSSLGCGTTALSVATLGLIGSEPTLPAAQPVAFALAPNSPLVDAGASGPASLANPAACLTSDAVGSLRPQSGLYGGPIRCDIGPLEFIGPMFRDGFED